MQNESLAQSDDFKEAVNKVKACAAATTSLYLDETTVTYTPELLQLLASELHSAARYFDRITTETAEN